MFLHSPLQFSSRAPLLPFLFQLPLIPYLILCEHYSALYKWINALLWHNQWFGALSPRFDSGIRSVTSELEKVLWKTSSLIDEFGGGDMFEGHECS